MTNQSSTVIFPGSPSTIQVPNDGASTSLNGDSDGKSDGAFQFQTMDSKVFISMYMFMCLLYTYIYNKNGTPPETYLFYIFITWLGQIPYIQVYFEEMLAIVSRGGTVYVYIVVH